MKKLIATLLTCIFTFTLIACGGNSAEDRVKEFFKDIKDQKVLTVQDLANTGVTGAELDEAKLMLEMYEKELDELAKLSSKLTDKIEGKIMSTTETENSAVIEVEITAIDCTPLIIELMGALMSDAIGTGFSSILSGEQVDENEVNKLVLNIFKETLENAEVQTVKRNFTVELEKTNDEWVILNEEALMLECLNLNSLLLDPNSILT